MTFRSTSRTRLAATSVFSALLLAASGSALAQGSQPRPNPHLYSEQANPTSDIAAAVARAGREHKRILLDFGGNWCGDCQVLDIYYRQSPNADLIAKHFILVHINIGHMDANVDVARKYNVPITRGVPALAVLDSHGKLLYAEHEKEFEHTSMEAVTQFLNRWKS